VPQAEEAFKELVHGACILVLGNPGTTLTFSLTVLLDNEQNVANASLEDSWSHHGDFKSVTGHRSEALAEIPDGLVQVRGANNKPTKPRKE
jgi:hypothetical protein